MRASKADNPQILTVEDDLTAVLATPEGAHGLIVLARPAADAADAYFARRLRAFGFATLSFDVEAEASGEAVAAMAGQLLVGVRWVSQRLFGAQLAVGYAGTGTGARLLLDAVAASGMMVPAAVLRGVPLPESVPVPTLLLIGGRDEEARGGVARLPWRSGATLKVQVVETADSAFTQPGAADAALEPMTAWFGRYLVGESRIRAAE